MLSIRVPEGVKDIKNQNKKQLSERFCRSIRYFAVSVGAAAVCMLAVMGLLEPLGAWSKGSVEASAFNAGPSVSSSVQAAAGDAAPLPKVIPLGSAFGIKMFTDGVIVASLSDIYTEEGSVCPAKDSGIQPGDYVVAANGQMLLHNSDLARVIGGSAGEPVELTVRREEETFSVSVTPVFSDGTFKTGMWIRDSAAGIGTLTFCDPETGAFAGLGHGICDMDTNGVIALKSGEPAPITLCGIVRGEKNNPGQLRGYFSSDAGMGALTANNETGVYGTLTEIPEGKAIEVLPKEQVTEGMVQLLVTLDETGPQLYDAEIERVSHDNARTRNLILRVTDERLLERTGGIVQGMSGCPILQNGKLAGAVTHVFTEDPTRGYGIFAQTMAAEISSSGMVK